MKLVKIKKDNAIRFPAPIVEASYTLSVVEQKIIFALSADLSEEGECKINKFELGKFCGFSQGHLNREIDIATDGLMQKIIKFYDKQDTEYKKPIFKTTWLHEFAVEKNTDFIRFKVSKKLVPYFKELHKKYVKEAPKVLMQFKHIHTIRIYMLIKNQLYKNELEFSLLELATKLDIAYKGSGRKQELSSYLKMPGSFKQKIIEPAILEINKNVNINLSVEYKKDGRKITGVIFRWNIDDEMKSRRTKRAKEAIAKKSLAQKIENKKFENPQNENQTSFDFDELLEENLAYNEIAYKENDEDKK